MKNLNINYWNFNNRIALFILLLFISNFYGCASKFCMIKKEKHVDFTALEVLMITENESQIPFKMVKNNTRSGDKFLRTSSLSVNPQNPLLKELINRMETTLIKEKGVGIAAPQIGISRRVIIVKRLDKEPLKPFEFFINPEIVYYSEKKVIDWEGCLSIPKGFGKVLRSEEIEIEYNTIDNKTVKERIKGFTARIFQHELDHLNGILFVDDMESKELIPKDEYRKLKKKKNNLEQETKK